MLRAFGLTSLKFGREYIVPKPLDPRLLLWEAPAVAAAAMESGVARKPVNLDDYRLALAERQGRGERLRHFVLGRARQGGGAKRVVFADGEEPNIVRAAAEVARSGIGQPILLGRQEIIAGHMERLGIDRCGEIVDHARHPRRQDTARTLAQLGWTKGVPAAAAEALISDPNVFAAMMLQGGEADAVLLGMRGGSGNTVLSALQALGEKADAPLLAGVHIVVVDGRTTLFADTAVTADPSAEELAEIARLAADFAVQLGLRPAAFALLSGAGSLSTLGAKPEKMRHAAELLRRQRPDLSVAGEGEAFGSSPSPTAERFPTTRSHDADVLVFPTLEAATIALGLVARQSGGQALGPILLGTGAPAQVVQPEADVRDIVQLAALAVMEAARRAARST